MEAPHSTVAKQQYLESYWVPVTDAANSMFKEWSIKCFGRDLLKGTLEELLPCSISTPGYGLSLPGRTVCRLMDAPLTLHVWIADVVSSLSESKEDIAMASYVLPAYLVIELFAEGANVLANTLLFRYGMEGVLGLSFLIVILAKFCGSF